MDRRHETWGETRRPAQDFIVRHSTDALPGDAPAAPFQDPPRRAPLQMVRRLVVTRVFQRGATATTAGLAATAATAVLAATAATAVIALNTAAAPHPRHAPPAPPVPTPPPRINLPGSDSVPAHERE